MNSLKTAFGIGFTLWTVLLPFSFAQANQAAEPQGFEYRLLATTRTSTMEKEMNQAASEGFRFASAMGGETAFGGSETVLIMMKPVGPTGAEHRDYRLLATQRTSTMQKELNQAADEGFVYCGQTLFETTFGGREVVVIMERDPGKKETVQEYYLLATSKTSTMQKELNQAGQKGFVLVGLAVGKTSFGGDEVVAITSRPKR